MSLWFLTKIKINCSTGSIFYFFFLFFILLFYSFFSVFLLKGLQLLSDGNRFEYRSDCKAHVLPHGTCRVKNELCPQPQKVNSGAALGMLMSCDPVMTKQANWFNSQLTKCNPKSYPAIHLQLSNDKARKATPILLTVYEHKVSPTQLSDVDTCEDHQQVRPPSLPCSLLMTALGLCFFLIALYKC